MKDSVLIAWLICDVLASVILLGGCAYVVFWLGHSPWWFLAAFIFSCSFGGSKLYQRLSERTGKSMEAK